MDFKIFLYMLKGSKKSFFERDIVTCAFRHLVESTDGDCWQIVLPDSPCLGQIHIEGTQEIKGFSVKRPPFELPFWDALFEVMRQTPTLLFWPGSIDHHSICCVANTAAASEPAYDEFRKAMRPSIVSCGAEIEACIARNV
jgi:hypothetical protein